jgi:hypothetical protein
VFFENSTWRLRYRGDPILPFQWERISIEFGSSSTFTTVVRGNECYTYSRMGWVKADTNKVERIDLKIPTQAGRVDSGDTGEGYERVHAIRDTYRWNVYWAIGSAIDEADSPNEVWSYNYVDESWSKFNQSFRTFGKYKNVDGLIWSAATFTWSSADFTWDDPIIEDNFPTTVAGSTSGDVFTVYEGELTGQDNGNSFGFDIRTKRFNPYMPMGKKCRIQYVDFYVTGTSAGEFTIDVYVNDNIYTPVLTRTVLTSTVDQDVKYTRVFLGLVGWNFQIRMYMTPEQIASMASGPSSWETQGMVLWTKPEGVIKNL